MDKLPRNGTKCNPWENPWLETNTIKMCSRHTLKRRNTYSTADWGK